MSSSVVAVVDHAAGAAIVWWVDLGPRPAGMSRMCGAWVLEEQNCPSTVAGLTTSRLIVTTAAGRSFLEGNRIAVPRRIDVGGSRAAVVEARDQLQSAYEEAVKTRKNGRSLITPTWPAVPEELDVERIHTPAGDPRTGRSLAIARWFDDLCAAWDRIEDQRLARAYLRVLGGPVGRLLPVVCGLDAETSVA